MHSTFLEIVGRIDQPLVDQLTSAGGKAIAIQADVSDADAVANMFDQLDSTWQGVDILVNNAGIDGKSAVSREADIDDWQWVIEVNLFGAFHCAREALRRMVPARSGVIVNMTSVHDESAVWRYRLQSGSSVAEKLRHLDAANP